MRTNDAPSAQVIVQAAPRPAPEKIALASLGEVYDQVDTRPGGLTHDEAAQRLLGYGRNSLVEIKGQPLLLKFLVNFTHLMALLLWVGGLVAFVAQMPELGVAIWLVNIINGAFSFWQEYKAEQATAAEQGR
ncbi:MAG TPA: cation-transporting P-type ATPase, partial [Caldilineaceae bacterium]|nr:cation-transporting P-type ATPase [Caldilineaceae bacterium]